MSAMKRTPLKKKRTGPKRRTLSPRCVRQRCDRIARIGSLCVPHAEHEADTRFSLWIRQRDGGCTAFGLFTRECSGPLQAAHIVGRRNHAVRFHPSNVWTLCAADHRCVDQYGQENAKYKWAVFVLGSPDQYDALMVRANLPADRVASIEAALSWLAPTERTEG